MFVAELSEGSLAANPSSSIARHVPTLISFYKLNRLPRRIT
jgi:hypothetical protein